MANIRVTHGKLQVLLAQSRDTDEPIRVTHGKLQILGESEARHKILFYGSAVATGYLTDIIGQLNKFSYDGVGRDDATLATDTDWADFDAVVGHMLTSGKGDDLRAKAETEGVPYGFYMGNAVSIEAMLTGTIETGGIGSTNDIEIVDNSHVITSPFSSLEVIEWSTVGPNQLFGLNDGQSWAGQALGRPLGSGWVAGQHTLIAIAPGTDDLDTPAVPTTQRCLLYGWDWNATYALTADGKVLFERMWKWLTGELVSPPAQPTITATVESQTQVTLEGSVYLSGQGGPHIASQWQVTLDTDLTFLTPVYDSGEDTSFLTVKILYDLIADTDYIARVRYLEDADPDDVWSAWSDHDAFSMDAAPDTPTISHLSSAADRAAFEGSAFNSSDFDRIHAATEWQLTLAADTGFATPLETQLVTFGDLLTFNFSGLNLWANQYIARVRYQDDKGGWSLWSAASSATGIIADGQFYTAFAERPVGIDIADDVLADWDEMVDGDQSVWPIEVKPDAVCEVVSHRSSEGGTAEAVDPIFWQGFQQVDEQIVWARIQFEYEGGGEYPCGSGVRSPKGLICRTNHGLLQTADMENDLFDVYNDGSGSVWSRQPEGGPNGEPTIRVVMPPGKYGCEYPYIDSHAPDSGVGIGWASAGVRPAGQWAQFKSRSIVLCGTQTYAYLAAWPAHRFCLQTPDHAPGIIGGERVLADTWPDGYTGDVYRFCTLYLNWYRSRLLGLFDGEGVGETVGSQQWAISRDNWAQHKVGWDTGFQHYSYSFGGLTQVPPSKALMSDTHAYTGRVGFSVFRCAQYDPGPPQIDVLDWFICSANTVTFTGLPNNWRINIGTDTIAPLNWGWVDGSPDGSPVVFDFDTKGWPADLFRLYNPAGKLIEEWYVPDGIWGGDTYNINAGGLGVGPIGGAAVRLGP